MRMELVAKRMDYFSHLATEQLLVWRKGIIHTTQFLLDYDQKGPFIE